MQKNRYWVLVFTGQELLIEQIALLWSWISCSFALAGGEQLPSEPQQKTFSLETLHFQKLWVLDTKAGL